MIVRYPWNRLKPGEGFFVPALDTEHAKEMGLRAAVGQRVRLKAVPVIKDGLLGVWFFIPPQRTRPDDAPQGTGQQPAAWPPPDDQSADASQLP